MLLMPTFCIIRTLFKNKWYEWRFSTSYEHASLNFGDGIVGKIAGVSTIALRRKDGVTDFFEWDYWEKVFVSSRKSSVVRIVGFYNPQITNVQKIDEGVYYIGVNIEQGKTQQFAISELRVTDPCFRDAVLNNDTHCLETECQTSEGGKLMFSGIEQNTSKVNVCNISAYGVYNCCSQADDCIFQFITAEEHVDVETKPRIIHSDTEVQNTSINYLIASAVVVIFLVICVMVTLYNIQRRSRNKGNNVYFGVDGEKISVDPYNKPWKTQDEEVYASISENEMIADEEIHAIRQKQAELSPYEVLLTQPDEDDYNKLTTENQDSSEEGILKEDATT